MQVTCKAKMGVEDASLTVLHAVSKDLKAGAYFTHGTFHQLLTLCTHMHLLSVSEICKLTPP